VGDGMNREGAADRRWVRCGSLWMVRYAASDSSIARGVRSCTRGARVAACPDRGPFVREAVHRGEPPHRRDLFTIRSEGFQMVRREREWVTPQVRAWRHHYGIKNCHGRLFLMEWHFRGSTKTFPEPIDRSRRAGGRQPAAPLLRLQGGEKMRFCG